MKKRSVQPSQIRQSILIHRGQKVMLDRDLAELYGVETKRLNEQVKRNKGRFPKDFKEKDEVVANCDHLKSLRYSRTNPYAFTEKPEPPRRPIGFRNKFD